MQNKINESEIINQKKQFVFKVTQNSNYVFPNETYNYHIYIKNISGSPINNFTVKVENDFGVVFETQDLEHKPINIEPNEIKFYTLKAYCNMMGEHTVHFVGYGEETQILYQALKINCTNSYNSEKLMHRIHFYDFTPYEDNYTMEATNFNNQYTQTFKIHKTPYKSGEQPFPLKTNFIPENIESESFLEQYEEAKNTKEHVYQYIGRETFIEDSLESYTGENLFELFEKINKNSKYFRGQIFRTGTNTLLNDFRKYSPNGFIYRMGLLNSEIYQYLGVLPTYDYMSDKLFRWAPSRDQLLNIYPEKKAMKWGENIWAGKGWIIYKNVTPEYIKTSEYVNKKENHLIKNSQVIASFEDKESAETFIEKHKKQDDIERQKENNDLVKYNYVMKESLYETGVFFINIPIDKIPSNFYLLTNETLYSIINRAKPYGAKPIINYIIERNFNHHMDIKLSLNYHKNAIFDMPFDNVIEYIISKNAFINKLITCDNEEVNYYSLSPIQLAMYKILPDNNMDVDVDSSKINMNNLLDEEIEQEVQTFTTETDYELNSFDDILNILYQNNYEDISFKVKPNLYKRLKLKNNKNNLIFEKDKEENLILNNEKIESLKLPLYNITDSDVQYKISVEDIHGKQHEIIATYDTSLNMSFLKYNYINSNKKSFTRKRGYADIQSICLIFAKINNKKVLIFMIEDNEKTLHYFHHIIVQDFYSLRSQKIENKIIMNNFETILYLNDILDKNIIFETPFYKKSNIYQPSLIKQGENWTNLYRLNNKENSYTYIKNIDKEYLSPNDISLFYDYISIPETSNIVKMRLNIIGNSSVNNTTFIDTGLNTNYITENVKGYNLQLEPHKIEVYSHLNETSTYYQTKLDIAKEKNQQTYIDKFSKLLEENYIFNEDIDIETSDYLGSPEDFISINNEFWYEISEFTDSQYKLNEIESINLIIEGYNTEYECNIFAETVFETDHSSTTTKTIPSGFFRKKIPLLYSNQFLLNLLKVRFRFKELNHSINIFDTKIELKFKNKQKEDIDYSFNNEINLYENTNVDIIDNYYYPANINNGTNIKLSFEDLQPGDYYQINSTELEIIYEDTDLDIMINSDKYQNTFNNINKTLVSGKTDAKYLSGEFYNDVVTMSQIESNIGVDNKGIKLQESLYQLFETREDNITSIELFPHGFRGNPNEMLKISLYTNLNNTPNKLIKEVYVSGWVKNNPELKNLESIKYNFNVDNLTVNEKYWFKIEVLNPQENSYYLLKGINTTKTGFKLLANENNNYINTFSNLKFNIYSKNLSKSFNNIPALQEYFDNPYILIGLHKGQGSIERLKINKFL